MESRSWNAQKKIVSCEKALRAVERLSETYEILVSYGVEKYITFDLSMSGTYGYYTGIIFRGYTYGTGDAIVKGGRYDHLVEKFGKEFPSIGFAIVIDELMGAISRQKLEIPYHQKNTLILYEESERSRAIALAKEFRLAEKPTELVKKSDDRFLDEYVSYARQNFCGGMFYLKREDEILMTNLLTDEKKQSVGRKSYEIFNIALTKGRLAKKTLELLEQLGITCEEMKDKDSRKLIFGK